MVNFGPLAAEIVSLVSGTPANFNGFRLSSLGSVTARHSSSGGCQPNCGVQQRAPPIFGRAAITLGIRPHFLLYLFIIYLSSDLICKHAHCQYSVQASNVFFSFII